MFDVNHLQVFKPSAIDGKEGVIKYSEDSGCYVLTFHTKDGNTYVISTGDVS